ncbi:MAG: hypothetical protein LLF94_09015 [Chlamydiales bacterium]|nr:hypothetical protein [Chlamydiales bacterium]
MEKHTLDEALEALGTYLADKELQFEVVAIGGGALLLLGCIIRPTKDLDIVALIKDNILISSRPLPEPLQEAINEIGSAYNLPRDWINSGPTDLWVMGLPEGFQERLEPIQYGGLTLYCASRFDQICFKLYASVDQGPNSKHFEDLKRLRPTKQELEIASQWCKTHDVSEPFKQELSTAVLHLGELHE